MNDLPPLLIWTLQRSGGTNLTRRLEVLMGTGQLQHEPFNVGREFGQATADWRRHRDPARLAVQVQQACASRRLIKHCVELVPWEVCAALMEQASALGYRHLFLHRLDACERLASLEFARRLDVWGPGAARKALNQRTDVELLLQRPLPVDQLLRDEALCARRLNRAWRGLLDRGARPVALAFEEVYLAPQQVAEQRLLSMLQALSLSRGDTADRDFAREVLGRGDQRTRDRYARLGDLDKLKAALAQVERFQPVSPDPP